MPSTPDLSFTGLDEFVNKPIVENCKAMSSEEEPKVVRKYDDASRIKEWVSDDEEEDVSQPKIKMKIVRPSIVKMEFVKSKQQQKSARKTVKQVEQHWQNTQNYEEIDEGYVAFGGNPKVGKITRKDTIKTGTQSNGFLGTKASDNAGQARKETKPIKNYILLPLWTADPLFFQVPKSSHDNRSKPSSDDGKKVDEDPRKESECKDQEKEDNVNNTNNVNTTGNDNTVSLTVNAAGTNEVYVVDFVVYQMDVKSDFLYEKIKEEVYVCQPLGFEDPDFPNRVYKVEKAMYGLQQAPRAWFTEVKTASTSMETQKPLLKNEDCKEVDVHMYRSMIGSLMYLTSSRPDIMFT
nr:retrotransposon protein, putative, unclassified [Tanacetum cinerariifolium]